MRLCCITWIFEYFKICTEYREPEGERHGNLFRDADRLDACQPAYKEYQGYDDISKATKLDDLPRTLRNAMVYFEHLVGSKGEIISVGPEAHQTIVV